MTKGTVFVVEDDEANRALLKALFGSVGLDVTIYSDGQQFIDDWSPNLRGCAVIDIHMPRLSGIEVFEWLSKQGSSLPVIFLTGHGDLHLAVRAMKDGAFDFIEKPFNLQQLLEVVQKAIRADADAQAVQIQRTEIERLVSGLTPREREVLDRVVKGESNRGMAEALGLSEKTIEFHRAKMMEKMRAATLAELIMVITTFNRAGGPRS